MKDPIKFTDIESRGITIFLGIILIIMTIFLNSTVGLLWASIFAAVGILGIYLRAWRRSVSASINVFPLLNITAIEKWAVKISDHFNYIKTITLYEAPFVSHKKYVLFFNFDTSTVKGKNSKGTFDGHTWFNKWSKKNYPIDDSFKEIYKQNPPNKFFEEWLITTERPQGIDKRLSLVLYNKKTT